MRCTCMQVKRCDEMARKLRYLLEQVSHAKLQQPWMSPLSRVGLRAWSPSHLMCVLLTPQVQKAELAMAQGSRWDRGRGTTMDELEVGCLGQQRDRQPASDMGTHAVVLLGCCTRSASLIGRYGIRRRMQLVPSRPIA